MPQMIRHGPDVTLGRPRPWVVAGFLTQSRPRIPAAGAPTGRNVTISRRSLFSPSPSEVGHVRGQTAYQMRPRCHGIRNQVREELPYAWNHVGVLRRLRHVVGRPRDAGNAACLLASHSDSP
jgi:hypothetical protein